MYELKLCFDALLPINVLMRSVFRNIAILLFIALNQGPLARAAGRFLEDFHGLPSPYVSDGKFPSNRYVSPNELNPELAKPILEKTINGVYLTVGTERAFIAAALSPSAEHVVILDYNPNITIYNNINIELLKASYSPKMSVPEMRSRYLHLRFDADESEWIETFSHLSNADGRVFQAEEIREQYQFWKKQHRSSEFTYFNKIPGTSELAPFKNANYLYDNRLFEKVQNLAVENKIHSFVADLTDLQSTGKFLTEMNSAGEKISVFDISNAWYEQYLGRKKISELIRLMNHDQVLLPKSVILTTDHHNNTQMYTDGVRTRPPMFTNEADFHNGKFLEAYQWEYHGYSVDFLNAQSKNHLLPDFQKIPVRGTSFNADVLVAKPPPIPDCFTRFFQSLLAPRMHL